jgi:putative hydrolase of the HAD superfamily
MRATTLLVDAGGVLVHPDWPRVSAILRRAGIEVPPAALAAGEAAGKRAVDLPPARTGLDDLRRNGQFFTAVARAAGVDLPDEEALRAEHDRSNLWSVVAAGAPEALDRLRADGVTLVLVSNAPPTLPAFFGTLGLARRFDHLVVSGILGIEKPDPRIFREALRLAGARPEDAIHVGDLVEIDAAGARSAGIRAALVDPTGTRTDAGCPLFPDFAAVADAVLAARRA